MNRLLLAIFCCALVACGDDKTDPLPADTAEDSTSSADASDGVDTDTVDVTPDSGSLDATADSPSSVDASDGATTDTVDAGSDVVPSDALDVAVDVEPDTESDAPVDTAESDSDAWTDTDGQSDVELDTETDLDSGPSDVLLDSGPSDVMDVPLDAEMDTALDVSDSGDEPETDAASDAGPDAQGDAEGDAVETDAVETDASVCETVTCVVDADCDDEDPCTTETCDPTGCGACIAEQLADGATCGESLACFDGTCEEATWIEGIVTDPELVPVSGLQVRIPGDWVTATDAAGRFTLITQKTGEVVIQYGLDPGGAAWADHVKLLDLEAFTSQGVHPNASTIVSRTSAMDRSLVESDFYLPSWTNVAFGGVHITPKPAQAADGAPSAFVEADGTPWPAPEGPQTDTGFSNGLAMSLTTVTPDSADRRYMPDTHRAVRLDGTAVTLAPVLLFESHIWGLNEDAQPLTPLFMEPGSALEFNADARLDTRLVELCGNATYTQEHPLWWLDPSTGIWMEIAPEETYGAQARVNNGRCAIWGTAPGQLGWYAVGPTKSWSTCVSGHVVNAEGTAMAGVRVDGWSGAAAGFENYWSGTGESHGHAVTDESGAYCLPMGDLGPTEHLRLQTRVFQDGFERSSGAGLVSLSNTESGSCDTGGCKELQPIELVGPSCLQGTVVDAEGAPVSGVQIVSSAGTHATSGEDGAYCIQVPALRDVLLQARAEDGSPYGTLEQSFLMPSTCEEGCWNVTAFKPSECNVDADCESWSPFPEDLEDVVFGCHRPSGECRPRVAKESALIEHLSRLYRGAQVMLQRADRLDATGEPLGCLLPPALSFPIEGTCCMSGGLGGPDIDGDDRCDVNPDVWSGGWSGSSYSWADLAFAIGGETRQVVSVEPAPEDGTLTLRLRSDADCDEAQHQVVLHVQLAEDGCALETPTSLEVIDEEGASYVVSLLEGSPLQLQKLEFLGTKDVVSYNPHVETLATRATAMAAEAASIYAETCSFPANQGVTPIEGTCCSVSGLGGPDTDGDNQCDANPDVWQTTTWTSLGFALDEDQPFVFETEQLATEQTGVERYAIRAYGDLDCDSIQSTFTWFVDGVELEPGVSCTAEPVSGFFSRNESE